MSKINDFQKGIVESNNFSNFQKSNIEDNVKDTEKNYDEKDSCLKNITSNINNSDILSKIIQNNQNNFLANNINNNYYNNIESKLLGKKNNNINKIKDYNYSICNFGSNFTNDINNYNNIISQIKNSNNLYLSNNNGINNNNEKNNLSFSLNQNYAKNDINLGQYKNNDLNIINLSQFNNSNSINNININNIRDITNINNIYNISNINNNTISYNSKNLNMSNLSQNLNCCNSLNQLNINDNYNKNSNIIKNNFFENNLNNNNISNLIKNINNNSSLNKNFTNSYNLTNENTNSMDKNQIEEFLKFVNTLSIPLVNFLCTPKGTLEIQKKLGKSNSECIFLLIKLLDKEGLPIIMRSTYGNYFFQQIIKGADERIISLIISNISEDFIDISKDSSGTFSIQALLSEVSSLKEEQQILNFIKNHEMEMAFNKNATYVLQKIVLLFPDIHRVYLNEIILNNFKDLCLDSNGICLIKNFIKTNTLIENKKRINEEIVKNFVILAESPFGNYGIQYIIENWNKNELNDIKRKIIENIYKLSVQQFSSNVVEKAIEVFNDEQREKMIRKLCFEGNFIILLKNKFGRFVLHKAISYMSFNLKNDFEIYLINNINNNVYSHKDKNKVKKFIMKIKNNKLQNEFIDLNNDFLIRSNIGSFCKFDIKNNTTNINFGSNGFF